MEKLFKILVVEDNKNLSDELVNVLDIFGYKNIEVVTNGDDAISMASEFNPDLIIMDVVLKGRKDGIETAKLISKNQDIPTIFLTSLTDDEVIEKILETDGFIYLTKPFKIPELKTNIAMVYKKFQKENDLKIKSQSLEDDKHSLEEKLKHLGYSDKDFLDLNYNYSYDIKNKILYCNDKEVELAYKEKEFIHVLAQNRGKVMDFDTIKEYIWGDYETPNSTLRSLVRRVRKKVDDSLIKSIVNTGYKIE